MGRLLTYVLFSYDKVAIASLLHTMMQIVGNHVILMHLSKLKMDAMTSAWHKNQTVYCSIYIYVEILIVTTKGQIISEAIFLVFNSHKKQTIFF